MQFVGPEILESFLFEGRKRQVNEGWFPLQFSLKVLGNCQTSSDHFITCALHSRNVQFSREGGREGGRCRNTPKCPKVSGAKSGEGGMDAGLLFKAGNDLFGRSISGQTRTDLKRDQMRSRYKLWEDQQKQK